MNPQLRQIDDGSREVFWNAANVMPHPSGVVPPLTLAWTYDHTQAIREAPFVADDGILTATTDVAGSPGCHPTATKSGESTSASRTS